MAIREWLQRLKVALLGSDRRVDEELAFHRDMLEEKLRQQGRTPAEARRLAAVELGGRAQIVEAYADQRGLPMLETLAQDVRYGLRILRRAPAFTIAVVLTLAIGIGANTAVFTIVDAVLLRPLPFSTADRLVAVGERAPDGSPGTVGYLTVVDWQQRARTFDAFALMRFWQPTLVVNGEAERLPAVRVTWNYFDMLGVRPQLGRTFTADEDRPDHWRVVVLSDGLWRRRFNADPGIVGRAIVMNDREYRIVGVLPPSFQPVDAARYYAAAEIWAPVGYDASFRDACRDCRHLRAFGRLKPGVSIDQASAEMNAIHEQQRREYPTQFDAASSLAVVPLQRAITWNVRTALLVLLTAVAFVLLIACANVANLMIARSLVRRRELTLRGILGASRFRVARQLLTESALLGIGGAVLGTGLAVLLVELLTAFAPVSLPRLEQAAIDGRVLMFAVGVTAICSLLFGVMPAFRAGRDSLTAAASDSSRGATGGPSRARALLVVADLTLALVLLAGAGVMVRTVSALTKADPGFDASRMLTLQFSLIGKAYAEDAQVATFQDAFLQGVRALPGVEAVALAGQIPFGGNRDCRGFHARGWMKPNTADDPCIETYATTPDYLRTMGIPLRAGRFFDARDTAASQPVLVVSEATARTVWGGADPIGTQVRIGSAEDGPWRTVIGVVGDTYHANVNDPLESSLYLPQTQFTLSYLTAVVKVSTSDPVSLAAPVRDVLRSLDPAVPVYGVTSLSQRVTEASAQQRFVTQLLSGFAAVAVLLAAIGLYGVLSYTVAQRTREVGIRVALGATRSHVIRLVLARGGLLVIVGIVAGVSTALTTTRYLESLVYGVSPSDPVTMVSAAAILGAVALLAHLVPVRRALRVDPSSALRQD